MANIKEFIYQKSNSNVTLFKFIILCSILTYSLSILVGVTYRVIEGFLGIQPSISSSLPVNPSVTDYSIELLSLVVYAPLLETLIFQLLIISLLLKIINNKLSIIIISGIIFGLFHFRNGLLSVLSTTFTGLFLGYAFLFWFKKTNSKKIAFESAMGIHALHNFIVFLSYFIPSSFIFG